MVVILKDDDDKPKEAANADCQYSNEQEQQIVEAARQLMIEELDALDYEGVEMLQVEDEGVAVQVVEDEERLAQVEEYEQMYLDNQVVLYAVDADAVSEDDDGTFVVYEDELREVFVDYEGVIYRESDVIVVQEVVPEEPIQIEHVEVVDIPDIVIELIDEILASVMENVE